MFDVKILCEDKDLPKVMWALDGLVVGMPTVIPVRGAVAVESASGTKKVKSTVSAGTMTDTVAKILKESVLETITTDRIMEMVEEAGGARTSGYGVTANLCKIGVLKRNGRGTYTIRRRKSPSSSNNGVAASRHIAGQTTTLVERVAEIIRTNNWVELSFEDLTKVVVQAEGSAGSSYYVADNLVANGLLRRDANNDRKGTYIVQQA